MLFSCIVFPVHIPLKSSKDALPTEQMLPTFAFQVHKPLACVAIFVGSWLHLVIGDIVQRTSTACRSGNRRDGEIFKFLTQNNDSLFVKKCVLYSSRGCYFCYIPLLP